MESDLQVLWDMFQTIGLYRSLGHCFMLLQTSDLFPSAFCPCQNRLLKFNGFKVGNFLKEKEGNEALHIITMNLVFCSDFCGLKLQFLHLENLCMNCNILAQTISFWCEYFGERVVLVHILIPYVTYSSVWE